ncbi:hypothetical protein JXB27_03530 [Candidatus Woesearchaeota archaeon]|nr:hypothetical protein [Candidatus Woesearchaeota archaeon]
MALEDVFWRLEQMGFTDVFLPFILIYTIVFAILQKIQLFGEGKSRRFNAIISLALAIGVIIPHSLNQYPPGTDVVEILNSALPNMSLLIIAIVFILIIIGMFGGQTKWGENMVGGFVTVLALAAVAIIFGGAAGWWEPNGWLSFLSDPDIQAVLLIIAVFWIIISMVTKEEKEDKDAFTRMGRFFGEMENAAAKTEEKKGGK